MKIHRTLAGLFGYELIKKRKLNDTLEQHLVNVIAQENVNLVIDVGANKGQFASALRLHGYAGRIVSFEPLLRVFDKLSEQSKLDPQWFSYKFALGAENTAAELHTFSASEFSSMHPLNDYARRRFKWRINAAGSEKVQMRTLATMWPDVSKCMESPKVLLKLDTQGYDLEVLAGASAVLEHVRAIQAEISLRPIYDNAPRYLEALAEFERHGFEITGMYPVSRDKHSLAIIEYDCVMTRGAQPQTVGLTGIASGVRNNVD